MAQEAKVSTAGGSLHIASAGNSDVDDADGMV